MAAVATQADQAADLLQKLSMDSQAKTVEIKDATKKPSADSGKVENGFQTDRSVTPILPDFMDSALCYIPSGYPYYYGGYEGSGKEWEDFARYMSPDGVEIPPAAYGDNGSIIYHPGYGYTPYAPYSPAASPVPTMGHDGQLYGSQHYQYPSPYFQSVAPTSGSYPTTGTPAKGDGANAQAPLAGVEAKSKSNGIVNNGSTKRSNGAEAPKAMYPNSSLNVNGSNGRGSLPGGLPASGYQDPRFAYDGLHSPISWLESPHFSNGQQRQATSSAMTSSVANGNNVTSSRNQSYRPQLMGLHHPRPMSGMEATSGYYNRLYPKKFYGQYGNGYRTGLSYGSAGYDSRVNGRSWMSVDSKYKPHGRGNSLYGCGSESVDGLNELNRGPRAKSWKNQKGFTPVTLAVKGQNIPLTATDDNEEKSSSVTPDREQYNLPDFPETLADAKFFVIKSYSEDDVHKSIKYNVWASTPNGNKKLDAAYSEAQQKTEACPIFLFFSVNASGQFVGVAEMVGKVDFNKNVEYWQQDKWIGCFPVKWHIVKDVPNSLLKHIILENNENKPVTNSRDTQEVKLDQGLQMLKIFKDHTSKQCILDDFDFYEDRQKRIQEKKAKQQQYQKQFWEGKSAEEPIKELPNGDLKSQKSATEVVSVLKEAKPAVQTNGDVKAFETSAPESKVLVNGVTNG